MELHAALKHLQPDVNLKRLSSCLHWDWQQHRRSRIKGEGQFWNGMGAEQQMVKLKECSSFPTHAQNKGCVAFHSSMCALPIQRILLFRKTCIVKSLPRTLYISTNQQGGGVENLFPPFRHPNNHVKEKYQRQRFLLSNRKKTFKDENSVPYHFLNRGRCAWTLSALFKTFPLSRFLWMESKAAFWSC